MRCVCARACVVPKIRVALPTYMELMTIVNTHRDSYAAEFTILTGSLASAANLCALLAESGSAHCIKYFSATHSVKLSSVPIPLVNVRTSQYLLKLGSLSLWSASASSRVESMY